LHHVPYRGIRLLLYALRIIQSPGIGSAGDPHRHPSADQPVSQPDQELVSCDRHRLPGPHRHRRHRAQSDGAGGRGRPDHDDRLSGAEPRDLRGHERGQRQNGARGKVRAMQEHDMSWVRTEMALAQPAPPTERGAYAWVRKNLIATPGDTVLTVLGVAIVAWILPQIINWAFINAQWTGPNRTACATVAQGGI